MIIHFLNHSKKKWKVILHISAVYTNLALERKKIKKKIGIFTMIVFKYINLQCKTEQETVKTLKINGKRIDENNNLIIYLDR